MIVPDEYLSSDEDSDDFGGFDIESDHDSTESGFEEPFISTATTAQLLEDAMKRCDMMKVEELCSVIEDYNNFSFDCGWKPLTYASHLGKPELVEFFLEFENEKSIPINRNVIPAPLTVACLAMKEKLDENHYRCAELLLESGANPNFKDLYGVNALMTACKYSPTDIVKMLLDNSAMVNERDNDGWSPLFYAVNRGDESIVRLLLNHGADLNKTDKRDRYAYMIASDKGFQNLVDIVKPESIKAAEIQIMHDAQLKIAAENCNVLMDIKPDYQKEVYEMVCASGIGMDRYACNFLEKNISLRRFLLLKEREQLKEVDVNFSLHQKILLHKIKQFHLSNWTKKSLGLCPITKNEKQQSDDLKNVLNFLATLHRQIYVLRTSVKYFQEELAKYPDQRMWKKNVEIMVQELQLIIYFAQLLKESAKRIREKSAPYLLARKIS